MGARKSNLIFLTDVKIYFILFWFYIYIELKNPENHDA